MHPFPYETAWVLLTPDCSYNAGCSNQMRTPSWLTKLYASSYLMASSCKGSLLSPLHFQLSIEISMWNSGWYCKPQSRHYSHAPPLSLLHPPAWLLSEWWAVLSMWPYWVLMWLILQGLNGFPMVFSTPIMFMLKLMETRCQPDGELHCHPPQLSFLHPPACLVNQGSPS